MVYLICFDEKLKHAKHYIGFCEKDLDQRLAKHKAGTGAKIMRAVNEAGISYRVVRVWQDGDRYFERKLKNRKNSKFLCPICSKV